MNIFNIERAFRTKEERQWKFMYWVIDVHETIFPNHFETIEFPEMYPYAEEVLKFLSKTEYIKIILFTSSHLKYRKELKSWFVGKDIKIDYVNQNPECPTTVVANFDSKFYFNVLLDDKAGFEGKCDWLTIKNELIRLGKWS